MRLIDADTLCIPPEEMNAKMAVAYAPTIDAVSVKHGRWIDPAAEDCYRCSVCEEYTNMEMPRLLYHYCPNCGAKMDEVEG